MDLVAVGWIALQMTGSPFMVAVAAFARSAPMMVLGPFAGIVADRVSRAHLLLVTQAGGAMIALAFLAMFAVDAAGYWPLVALEGAFGILWSLDFPARRTALFSMLGASRVAQAVSLETVSMQIAKMVGPVDVLAVQFSAGASGYPWTWAHLSDDQKRVISEQACDGKLKLIRQAASLYGASAVLPFASHFTLWHPEHRAYARAD